MNTVIQGFLSGLGFIVAMLFIALVLRNPYLFFIPIVLLGAYRHRRDR